MQKTVVELFAGVGGFRCGLNKVELKDDKVKENGSWKFVWVNQWEPTTKTQDAFNCYTKRFGLEEASNKDINLIDKKEIPNHTLLVGGFPCQDYSVARTLASGKGIEGKKGVLWWNIADTLKAKKPPFVLLENVDRLLISPANQRARDFGIILRSFMDNGYAVQWRVINAGEYGLPQKRRRVFIFAYQKSTKYYQSLVKENLKDIIYKKGIFVRQFPIKSSESEFNTANISKDSFTSLVEISNNFKTQFYSAGVMVNGKIYTSKVEKDCNDIYPLKDIIEKEKVDKRFFLNEDKLKKFKYLKGNKKIPRVKPNGESYFYAEGAMPFPDNLETPARTMLTSEGGINRTTHVVEDYITKKVRLLTPVECERINGFPDNWTNTGMTDKRRNFMMGNALVVGIIERLGSAIESIIEKEDQ
jgi:DNA (cytosine-5)-methyltransferase 1